MISKLTFTAIITMLLAGAATTGQSKTEPVQSYGDAEVSSVLRLDEHVRLYCNIADLPPIIGKNIPVCIKGLKPSSNPNQNLELLMFLNDLLLSKSDQPHKIQIKNIERGKDFCLVADIYVDEQDLCTLLIDKKLANKVIEVPSSTPNTGKEKESTQIEGGYIASKSSKIYHRATCPHAKRMDRSKAIIFTSREDAEKTGRRPCKICKP